MVHIAPNNNIGEPNTTNGEKESKMDNKKKPTTATETTENTATETAEVAATETTENEEITIIADENGEMQRTAISYKFESVNVEIDKNGIPVVGKKKTVNVLNESDEKAAKRAAKKVLKNEHIFAEYKVKQLYKIPEEIFFKYAYPVGEPIIEKIG